jgi:hypothetical protein
VAGTSLAPIGILHGSFLFGIEPADHEALDGEAGAVWFSPEGAADVTDESLAGVMCVRVIVRLADVVAGFVRRDGTSEEFLDPSSEPFRRRNQDTRGRPWRRHWGVTRELQRWEGTQAARGLLAQPLAGIGKNLSH